MGSVRKSGVFTTVRTRGMEFLNADGSAPAPGSILAVVDNRGEVRPVQDIAVQSIDLSGGELTYTDASGLLVNGVPVGSGGGGFPPSNIRYFIFYNQNVADPPDALLRWPDGMWTDVSGAVSTADWTCSVVGFDYNYTGADLNSTAPQYIATCFPNGAVWNLRRRMPLEVLGNNAFMGFHIMAMRNTICDDRRFVMPTPIALSINPSGSTFVATWGDITTLYPEVESLILAWQQAASRSLIQEIVPVADQTYTIGSLQPATAYIVTARYQRYDGGLGAISSRTISTDPAPPPPAAPDAFLEMRTSRSFRVLWNNPLVEATVLRIRWAPGNGVIDVSTNLSPWTIDDLSMNTLYDVSAQYVFATGVSQTTFMQILTSGLPQPTVVLSGQTATSMMVSWTNADVPFWVESTTINWGSGSEIIVGGTSPYSITGLTPGTEYTVSVSFSDGLHTGLPGTATASTTSNAPGKPMGLYVDFESYPAIIVGWGKMIDIDHYGVYIDGVYTKDQVADSGGFAQLTDIIGLTPHQTYSFSVVAYNSSGVSGEMSDPYIFIAFPTYAPRVIFTATAASSNTIQVSWDPPPAYVTDTRVYWALVGTQEWSESTSQAGNTSYTITGLAASMTYDVYVQFKYNIFGGDYTPVPVQTPALSQQFGYYNSLADVPYTSTSAIYLFDADIFDIASLNELAANFATVDTSTLPPNITDTISITKTYVLLAVLDKKYSSFGCSDYPTTIQLHFLATGDSRSLFMNITPSISGNRNIAYTKFSLTTDSSIPAYMLDPINSSYVYILNYTIKFIIESTEPNMGWCQQVTRYPNVSMATPGLQIIN